MDEFCVHAEKGTGLVVNIISVLWQSSTGNNGAQKTLLDWHQDTNGTNRKNIKVTQITLLNNHKSQMRIHAKKIFGYDMIGCYATFVSSLWHASVRDDDSVIKIVLFMKYRDRTFQKRKQEQSNI